MKVVPCLDTDKLLETLYQKMSSDLSPYLEEGVGKTMCRGEKIRLSKWSDPYRFRAKYQLNSLFKRYICRQELANDKGLESEAFAKFLKTQNTVPSGRSERLSSFIVVQAARKEIRRILGKFDPSEHINFCRFGKRAAIGLSYRDSYLDNRFKDLTGTDAHIGWYKNEVIVSDDLLARCSKKSSYTVPTALVLSSVPKAWDKKRTILKNTVIGGFYSAGIGDLMVEKLRDDGYVLSRRPDIHRHKVRAYSRNLSHVTADLSAASDCFSWCLMNQLFPRSWYNAMKFGALRRVCVKGYGEIQTQSFMTMGMGFTFPAQSIAFLCILRAIHNLLGFKKDEGFVSVFGDDLIYPRKMHPYVVGVLTDIGFTINKDKTFCSTPFRESCGADYYDGIDVRPYQPEGSYEVLRGLRALSHLYKVYNGLAQRWSEVELPDTFAYLRTEMVRFTKRIHQVPSDFPDTSGIKSDYYSTHPCYMQPYENDNGTLCFESLSFKFRLREVPVTLPYLWDTLRRGRGRSEEEVDPWAQIEDSTVLIWVTKKVRRSRFRKPPIWVEVLIPHVTEKGSRPVVERSVTCSILLEEHRGSE